MDSSQVPYHGKSARPHPNRAMVEQRADNPLRMMGDLVAHHLQDVVHGSFTAVVHVVNTSAISQQQINYVWIYVLTGHVQRSAFVLVHGADVGPSAHQHLAHLEVTLQVPCLLWLRAGGVQGCEALVVLFVHGRSIAQVELDVVWETVPGRHV